MKEQVPLWTKLFRLPRNIRGCDLRDLTQGLSRLSLNQLMLLQCLYELNRENPDGVPLKKLAAELKVTPATASEMVDTLVRREIVERRHSETDRRAVAIRLQRRWRELFIAYEHSCEQRVEAFFASRPHSERDAFEKTVDALNAFLAARTVSPEIEKGEVRP